MQKIWKGIDVSDCQGKINHAQVAAAGCEFVIQRSVRRSGKPDSFFAANLEGFRRYGIPMSVYKYTYATTPAAAVTEAQQVIALLQRYGLECIVWWDVEDRDVLRPLGRDRLTACIQAARETIEAAGYRFGIYTGAPMQKERWFDFNAFAACPMWGARYYRGDRVIRFGEMPDEKWKPEIDRALWGWQFTSTGRIPGIPGNVDLDICWQDPTTDSIAPPDPGVIYTVSIADVWTREMAAAVASAYPGCQVHHVSVLDAGGIELWIASVADTWTRAQAEEAQRQLAGIGITGAIHQVRILG